ncbi:MAG TPA: aquaporin, partial [Planctomycetota bacterium]|nr:aquaporin [Planctomycetota bacterium]
MTRRVAAEAIGTALLLTAIVGSGIMAERLAAGNAALALLANSLATGAALLAILTALAPISGAHLNPAVTIAEALRRAHPWRETPAYVAAQIGGAFVGVAIAHAMFGEPIFEASTRARGGIGLALGEAVATFGLVLVVASGSRRAAGAPPGAIAAYVV